MAFIKVRDIKSKEESIINTDMIVKIKRSGKDKYLVFYSSGNVGAAYYEYDTENARKIFDAIGIEL